MWNPPSKNWFCFNVLASCIFCYFHQVGVLHIGQFICALDLSCHLISIFQPLVVIQSLFSPLCVMMYLSSTNTALDVSTWWAIMQSINVRLYPSKCLGEHIFSYDIDPILFDLTVWELHIIHHHIQKWIDIAGAICFSIMVR